MNSLPFASTSWRQSLALTLKWNLLGTIRRRHPLLYFFPQLALLCVPFGKDNEFVSHPFELIARGQ